MQRDVEQERLKLNEFKALYKALKTGVVFIDYLFFSFIYWLENKVIDNRVKNEVDEAIKEWETLQGELSPTQPPTPPSFVYTEKPSETSTRLPEMRITSSWYIDKVGERSEP